MRREPSRNRAPQQVRGSPEHGREAGVPGSVVYVDLDGARRHRFAVGSAVPCELRP